MVSGCGIVDSPLMEPSEVRRISRLLIRIPQREAGIATRLRPRDPGRYAL
jgi:hypothetical protein